MHLEKVTKGLLKYGLEVYAKETRIIYADEQCNSIARREERMVKSRIIHWFEDYINPEESTETELYVVYRRFGTTELGSLAINRIYLSPRNKYCWKCKRSLNQVTMNICPKCEGIQCAHDGACHYTCSNSI